MSSDEEFTFTFGEGKRLEYAHVYKVNAGGNEYSVNVGADVDVVLVLTGRGTLRRGNDIIDLAPGQKAEVQGPSAYVIASSDVSDLEVQVLGLTDSS